VPRDKLRANLLLKHYQLDVDLRHVSLYNDELAHLIQNKPADILPLVRSVALDDVLHPLTHFSSRMLLLKLLGLFCFLLRMVSIKALKLPLLPFPKFKYPSSLA
jgi:MCM N-terminal domain